MLNLSDKELDHLSREAAEKYEVEQDPAAWHKLEQLLDKELGRPSPVLKFSRPGLPFIYTPALIILIGATYFLLKPSKHTSNSTQKNYSSVSKQDANSNATQSASYPEKKVIAKNQSSSNQNATIKNNTPVESVNKEKSLPENKTSNISDRKSTTERTREINSALLSLHNKKDNPTPSEKNNKEELRNGDAGQIINSNNAEKFSSSLYNKYNRSKNDLKKNGQLLKDKINKEEKNIESNEYAVNNLQQKTIDKPATPGPVNLKPAIINGLQPLTAYTNYMVNDSLLRDLKMQETGLVDLNKNKHGRTLYTNRSLQIGLLFSPDFSEVRYNYNNKVGSNIGITLGYQLTSTLSVNSGLVFTNKNYTAIGYDFHAPPDYWTNRVDLEYVKGNCHMLEIPLNLRYDFNKAGNTSFFINGGLSSYLLKKESYDFYYHDYNLGGFLRIQQDDYATNHNYWFSVLNLSAGFETKISNSFSFQVEPYMKLPLTGIGLGKVDLSSYGINLSIKFAPILKQSRR